jgi:hypothetical protein
MQGGSARCFAAFGGLLSDGPESNQRALSPLRLRPSRAFGPSGIASLIGNAAELVLRRKNRVATKNFKQRPLEDDEIAPLLRQGAGKDKTKKAGATPKLGSRRNKVAVTM